jgi:hypothetical protein
MVITSFFAYEIAEIGSSEKISTIISIQTIYGNTGSMVCAIVPGTWEAETGGSLEPRSSRLGWAVRPLSHKRKTKTKQKDSPQI